MAKHKFLLIKKCIGYVTKPDKTNASVLTLVDGSQNVLINDQEKIKIRKGFSLLGTVNTTEEPGKSSKDWHTSTGTYINLRARGDEVEIYTSTLADYVQLYTGTNSSTIVFAEWWDDTEKIDKLLWVDGTDKIFSWSGGITTYASATSNTLTKEGTNTWAEDRFLTSGTRKVRILDDAGTWREFTYTGGEATTTLTGVTPDPTALSFTAGANAFQVITTDDNTPADKFLNNTIAVLNNQVYVGSNKSRLLYISKSSDFTNYTHSSPRVEGEGEILTMDNVIRALVPMDREMWVSCGRNQWYNTEFESIDVAGTLTEIIKVKPIMTGTNQGARSQHLTEIMGKYIAFINFDNELVLLGNIETLENQVIPIISDPIKPDFDDADFTGGEIKRYKNRLYISAPNDDKVFVNEIKQNLDGSFSRFWQPPQTLPVQSFSIISGKLYGHSNRVAETYKLFDGTNDNENSFTARASLAYRNFSRRDLLKVFEEHITEGYISPNTKLKLKLNYDFDGSTQKIEKTIDGSNAKILFNLSSSGSLGDNPIGDSPLGDQPEEESQLPKFRAIVTIPKYDFFELQETYETDSQDAQWELLARGPRIEFSKNFPINIKI